MAGYTAEAEDGMLGNIDRVSYSGNYLFVSTGRFIRHRYLIPAGVVERVDRDSRSLVVAVTKAEVENAPVFNRERGLDEESERQIGGYYSRLLARRSSAE